jgi:hypothetical protein
LQARKNITFGELFDSKIALADDHAGFNLGLPTPPRNPPPELAPNASTTAEVLALLDSMFGSDMETDGEEREERAPCVHHARRIARCHRRRNRRGWEYLVEWCTTYEARKRLVEDVFGKYVKRINLIEEHHCIRRELRTPCSRFGQR